MKQHLLLLGLAGLLFTSCGSTDEIIDDLADQINLPDRIASGRAKAYAYNASRTDSTLSQIDYQYYTPQFSSGVMDSSYKDVVNARIVELAAMESPDVETQLIGPLTDYYFERVVNDFTVDEVDDLDSARMHTWSMEAGFDIIESKKYILLNSYGWAYTGGAHGNGHSLFEYFLKSNGEKIGLHYFVSNMDALLEVAIEHFREQQDIEEGASLNEMGFWFDNDEFQLNDNFYFDSGNLNFVFNPYEIAPYAAGTIELSIPLSDLEGIVTQ